MQVFFVHVKKLSTNLFFLKSALEWANSSQIALFLDSLNMHIISKQILNHNFFGILYSEKINHKIYSFFVNVSLLPIVLITRFATSQIYQSISVKNILARYRFHCKIQENKYRKRIGIGYQPFNTSRTNYLFTIFILLIKLRHWK